MGKIIGIISIKGGVGKTTTIANLAYVLANEFNQKVLVVDANFSAPNFALHYGLVDPQHSLQDYLNNKVPVSKVIHNIEEYNFHLITSSLKKIEIPKDYKVLKRKLEPLKEFYDVILIDSSPSLNKEMFTTIYASDELLVVTTPDHLTLAATIHAVKLAKERKTPIAGLILNKVRNKKYELTIDEIEEATGVPVIAIVPDHDKVLEALANLTPLALYKPKHKIATEYKKIAAFLLGQNYYDTSLLTKIKKFFFKTEEKPDINRAVLLDLKNKEWN